MRYMFGHFPAEFRLTLLAASTQEDAALKDDVKTYEAALSLVKPGGTIHFARAVHGELCRQKYDVILSQGFVSAVSVYLANLAHKVPHIVTIHGIVEPQYLSGRFGSFKRWFLGWLLSRVSVLYGVSNDILEHLYNEFPRLRNNGPQPLVILNGIEPDTFDLLPKEPLDLRAKLGIDGSTFLFGFFGRFMPQKGFDLLIEAVNKLRVAQQNRKFVVVAVGSGDYIREYQETIKSKGLEPYFHFLPFQPMVHHLYPQVDTVVMPSRWEACPLLPMEVLCMGTPLIAANCIGTREIINDTPTFVIEENNLKQLIEMMLACMQDNMPDNFQAYQIEARKRFNVATAAKKLVLFLNDMPGHI
ncbi:glycosyltransferase family 4 protein [Geobacter benzoatilyticus]|uniref:Glycosyltransferase family 4 protein n=1 Tax=Geobacter benzoatilyticus TaxID=2815309 RepID=A0ABX7Q0V9_9BACT|nr:glycosyltransferase family 4 protein [Geobacter benzoatilyticus]QSV45039.1 glycosyltransferase family 4 protein [Geobacter benzoatilyticus]